MIERIFSGAVTRGKKVQKEGKISYADFVWFLISEEDKKTPTSMAIEALPFEDCLCQMLDLVKPQSEGDAGGRVPPESESEGPEMSDWERYAAEEYDILAELSPVDQKLGALRSPLAQRPFFEVPTGLGTVELYEYECGDDDLPPS
ncbi:hypothetical protein E2I00_016612 [Balaenoptera physalus]|uniref:Uncharacterized protein n=1 Tax=Balaenoptera physalus TaxID=9770 RepID=A0A643C3D6_BALPH|nr:hypothetical protein E2I00_016612 [Balaenoptera physalus]